MKVKFTVLPKLIIFHADWGLAGPKVAKRGSMLLSFGKAVTVCCVSVWLLNQIIVALFPMTTITVWGKYVLSVQLGWQEVEVGRIVTVMLCGSGGMYAVVVLV